MEVNEKISTSKRQKKPVELEVEKKVYTPDEIRIMLGLSKSTTYQFLNKAYEDQSPFKVIKLNTVMRVPKEGFDAWLNVVN
jgi:hypothetical protein